MQLQVYLSGYLNVYGKYKIDEIHTACLYILVNSSTNGDMYVGCS
jgi:hypothetical protein